MRYTGIQPQYFPRLHYFARILATDVFVVRDDAQFVRKHKYPDGKTGKSYQAHTPMKQSFGIYLLMVPTRHTGFVPIHETLVSYDQDWVESHLRTLHTAYAHAKNFELIYPEIEGLLKTSYKTLAELNIATILWSILRLLGTKSITKKHLSIPYVLTLLARKKLFRLNSMKKGSESSALTNNKGLTANEKIVALCKEVGTTEDYCGGTGVAAYVDRDLFTRNGIKITVQDWKCKPYPQQFLKKTPFIPNLSIIDLLMNVSRKEALAILKG